MEPGKNEQTTLERQCGQLDIIVNDLGTTLQRLNRLNERLDPTSEIEKEDGDGKNKTISPQGLIEEMLIQFATIHKRIEYILDQINKLEKHI